MDRCRIGLPIIAQIIEHYTGNIFIFVGRFKPGPPAQKFSIHIIVAEIIHIDAEVTVDGLCCSLIVGLDIGPAHINIGNGR